MRLAFRLCFAAVTTLACASNPAKATILHNFVGGPNDGASPTGSLLQSGSHLYGVTDIGGSNGTAFQINLDGSGFQLLHSFTDTANDGGFPVGGLIQSGSTFYGASFGGGSFHNGSVFQMNSSGGGFSLLHSFAGGAGDGSEPQGALFQIGPTVFGETAVGGVSNIGTLYKVNTDGSGFQLLHSFAGGHTDGSQPYGSLIASGNTLFGTTLSAGSGDSGTVFSISADGSGYKILHNFTGASNDGSLAIGTLVQSGSTLYGMTFDGGAHGDGTIYKINTDGSGFQLLYSFNNLPNGGEIPFNSLTLVASTLYGMERLGGTQGLGSVFRINTDGSDFETLYNFAGGSADGEWPDGSLTVSGSELFGMTTHGGSRNEGVIFGIPLPEPGLAGILVPTMTSLLRRRRRSSPR